MSFGVVQTMITTLRTICVLKGKSLRRDMVEISL